MVEQKKWLLEISLRKRGSPCQYNPMSSQTMYKITPCC